MIHLNGNLLCAIDTETTGLDPLVHDVIQIAIVPLDSRLQPSALHAPFELKICPRNIENIDWNAIKINKLNMAKIINTSPSYEIAALLFDDWFTGLKLAEGKRISPLGHNWAFDLAFIKEWIGPINFDQKIDGRYRDTMTVALFLDDSADNKCEPCPFPKVSLKYACAMMDIEWDIGSAHDALYDCMKTAELYRALIQKHGKPSLF